MDKKRLILITILSVVCAMLLLPWQSIAAVRAQTSLNQVILSMDGVELHLTTPLLPAPFIEPEPDNAIQVASAVRWNNFQEISITAVPFGTRPPTEGLPVAQPGMEQTYRTLLQEYRQQQGGEPQVGPRAVLFDRTIQSTVSIVNLHIDGNVAQPVEIVEWVVEAGPRLWIVRVSQKYEGSSQSPRDISKRIENLSTLDLSSPDLNRPSTSLLMAANTDKSQSEQALLSPTDLPFPSWWNGDCDTNNYYAKAGIWAYPLGGAFQGLKACGPRPYFDGAPDVLVHFFPDAWGEYEWECVELSMRYLYLAFGVAPYSANGSGVVWNYSGSRLIKITNGTAGKAPKAGDVLSYNITAPYGHTSVVVSSNVDANGNGSIGVLEQNGSANGYRTHNVANWSVQSSQDISGWLHDPQSDDTTAPTIAVTQQPATGQWYNTDQTIVFTISDAGSGVRGYKVAWDQNPPGGSEIAGASGSVNLSGAGQGQHTLYIQAWDNVGNASTVTAIGWFGYDTVAPAAPTQAAAGCAAQSNVWQNSCADPSFTFSGASDATSGIAGYQLYWGSDPNGTSDYWTGSAAFDPGAPGEGTYYFRARAKDNAGHWSGWVTLFTFRYDATAPTGAVTINQNASVTYATLVRLFPSGSDALSGPDRVRFRDAGGAWSAWVPLGTTLWQLPGPTGQTFSVEMQVRDRAGNESAVYADNIALNIYPARPASAGYRLTRSTWGAAAVERASAGYRLLSTLGQPSLIGSLTSSSYRLTSGYWAGYRPVQRVYLPLVLRNR